MIGTAAGAAEELLYLGELTRVSRRTLADGTPVVAKEFLGQNAVQRARHERRILERLAQLEGVPRLVPGSFPPATVVVADAGGVPLSALPGRMEIPALVELAAKLAATLAEVHRAGVAHKSIDPSNILLGASGDPVLIDFSLATTLAEERPAFVHHREIAGNLPYLAPEQTGRTGRGIDQRADLYALGATLYQLSTGIPPFGKEDPLQLVHDILALVPPPPAWRNPQVPRALNDMIMLLLEKEPDRRYQSAQGLAHDLCRLRRSISAGGGESFRLGERDFALRLSPPSRLIGRDAEVAALNGAFERALSGELSCFLVAGGPGVGKSTLLSELRPAVTARRGFFAVGKFDQHRRDLESDAFYQALRALGRLLLAEPEAELALMRERLLQALGPNAGLTAALLPEFALLMGEVPPPTKEQLNAKERLVQATLDLLKAVASPQRPLVLVTDDLQWAPPAPVAVVEILTRHPIPGLLMLGAFRDNEAAKTDPLCALLSRWSGLPQPPPLLMLGNLPIDQLALFLKEMLRLAPEQSLALARSVYPRTHGNPYHSVEFVNALRRDGILAPSETGWSWEEEGIRRYLGSGDVVALLEGRIRALPAESQELLELMACLGGEVEPELLAVAAQIGAEELEERLTPPFQDGLLVSGSGGRELRFKHDKVQQAAYARIETPRRNVLHLTLARRLSLVPGQESLAAEQYLPVLEALPPEERRMVAGVLHRAAEKSQRVRFAEVARFLAAALELLESVRQPEDQALLAQLETKRHAALYSLGRLEEADAVYRSLERRSRDPLQRAEAACIQICSFTNRGMGKDAVQLGLGLLEELGVSVPPEEELAAQAVAGLERFIAWSGEHDLDFDLRRPELKHPAALAAARLINPIIPSAFFIERAMISWWLVAESQRLWIEHGPCAALVGPLSHLGFVSVCLKGDYRAGGRGVRHILEVSEARGWEPETSQSRFLYTMTVAPWFHPLQENVVQSLRAEEGLLQGGDLQNAGFTYYATMAQFFDCAVTLDVYAAEMERALAFAEGTGNMHIRSSILPFHHVVSMLRGEESCARRECLCETGAGDGTSLGIAHIAGGICGALTGSQNRLQRHASAILPTLHYAFSTHLEAQARLVLALAAAQQAQGGGAEREAGLSRLDEERAFLALRAADCPGNFAHLLKWMDAERAWAVRDFQGALASFDAALAEAWELQRPWHRALIAERAALFHLESGLTQLGRILMAKARRLYEEWGAPAKVRLMERSYPFLRAVAQQEGEPPRSVSADAIDLRAILRASQALSSETSLERLRSVVVELLRTMTGATGVSLVLRGEHGDWFLVPPLQPEGGGELVPLKEAAAGAQIPLSVFNFALRTLKPLMVEDATADDRFGPDRYLTDYACCSMLAVPILNQGTPRAMLLLENRLCRGAFTCDLLDAVTLIAGQLAVSLENALLYRKLEERVEERTRELQEAQSGLMAAARHAGMAEIASNVLHNVGNVLNSVNVSTGVVMDRLRVSRLAGLEKSVLLLDQHAGRLGEYLGQDKKGKLLPGYLKRVAQVLAEERQGILDELARLSRSVDHIKEIVATQQCYAGGSSLVEPVQVADLVEDALRMNLGETERRDVAVVREFAPLEKLPLDKARVLQILVNLICNARQAMEGTAVRRMTLGLALSDARLLRITVADTGEGILPENLSRIFSHGFTTKKGGHGFGLHSCALAAREMGGTLTVSSAGAGEGATFVLELPVCSRHD